MRNGKSERPVEIEQSNQEKKRILGEKENYKFLGILETDTIKQAEMKEKLTKENLDERESISNASSTIEISSKEKITVLSPL